MGYGDELLGSGMARGAAARGKRIAFGDGRTIMWRSQAHEIYRDNPNVACPGNEGAPDLEWIPHYRGHRLYATAGVRAGKWVFNDFTPVAGEVFLTHAERFEGRSMGVNWDVIIEPSVKDQAPNKQWPVDRYQLVASLLRERGLRVAQFAGNNRLKGVTIIAPTSFRHAMAVIRATRLYIGPEGGLHHAAAAMGTYAIVLFGGFISPKTTGYPGHINLTGTDDFCGTLRACSHCRDAMNRITVDQVINATEDFLHA